MEKKIMKQKKTKVKKKKKAEIEKLKVKDALDLLFLVYI